MLSIELCTEISIPRKDGYLGEGSGYTLAPGWVLTAHHVLFGDDVEEGKGTKITIVWRQAPEQANGEPPSVAVARKHIAWADRTLDLALIRCPLPDLGVEPPRADSLIARAIPDHPETPWESYGFLSEFGDSQGRRDTHNPSGILGRVNPREEGDSIQVTKGAMDDERAWAGFSGSPVFCAGKLLAVVSDANPGRRGASLRVAFLPHALEVVAGPDQEGFAALLGIDLEEEFDEALRAWFTKLFVRKLEHPDSVTVKQEAIALFSQRTPGAGVANPEQLALALLDSTPVHRVAFMMALYEQLREQPTPAQNATLHELAILMLCLVFPDQVAVKTVISQRRKGASIIDSDTADRLDTEIALAASDQVPPRIQYRGGRPFFPYNVSPKEERCGLNEPHKRAVEDMAAHLLLKSVPGDCSGVLKNLWSEVYARGGAGDLATRVEHSDAKLKNLAQLSGMRQRRYYVLLPCAASHDEQAAWTRLKGWFERLDLVKPKPFADPDTTNLISLLEQIILETQGNLSGDQHD